MSLMKYTALTKFALLLIIAMPFSGFQCDDDEEQALTYDFIIKMNITPLSDIYNIGDTINLSYSITNNSLRDKKTNNDVTLGGISRAIPFELYMGRRVATDSQNEQDSLFSLLTNSLSDGLYQEFHSNQQARFSAEIPCETIQDDFSFDLKFVPHKTGVFKISARDYHTVWFNENNLCGEELEEYEGGDLLFKFGVSDTHPELIEEAPLPQNYFIVTDVSEEERAERKETFWFKVQ